MIRRIVEYVIACDSPDCNDSCAYGWFTRNEAVAAAPTHGWVRCTRNRWLCQRCAARLLKDAAIAKAEKVMATHDR